MKTIGLIGGLSWQSTQTYYHIINKEVNKKLGENHSAKILMYSFDFEEVEILQNQSEWEKLNVMMADVGKRLEYAGADCLLICSNTMHDCATYLEKQVSIPLLHIADAVGQVLIQQNTNTAGLLGTRFLMQSNTYAKKLKEDFNIKIVIPEPSQREMINEIIYLELVKGILQDRSRKKMLSVIDNLMGKGIEAVILGCTEIPLLIKQEDCQIPVINTTDIHARSAVNYAISI
jgi:aspartate racemase